MNSIIEGISKALHLWFTPKYPPWGQGVKKELMRDYYSFWLSRKVES